jgi:hypothetical protein
MQPVATEREQCLDCVQGGSLCRAVERDSRQVNPVMYTNKKYQI